MLNSTPSIRIRSFLQLAPYLAQHGVSPIDFFRRLGISPNIFQNPDAWLPRAICFHVANEMVEATGDPFGGAHVGHMTELRSLGNWGKSVLRSADVAHACEAAEANAEMLHIGSSVRFMTDDRVARIVYRFTGRDQHKFTQFIFGSLAVLRKIPLMAGEPSAIRVHLTAPKRSGDHALEECFGPNIETGAQHDMIEFDRELLDMPLRGGPDHASKVTDALRSSVQAAGVLVERLFDRQQIKLAVTARKLGMSPRTLQRRLKFCGLDFEELLDETRRGEALRLIAEEGHTMTEIAFRLGYSDPAHFTRAFRRWTGESPTRFRAVPQE